MSEKLINKSIIPEESSDSHELVKDIERAQIEAFTAKPYMDALGDALDAKKDIYGEGVTDEQVLEYEPYLKPLANYASQRAEVAGEEGNVLDPTDDEKIIIDAYKANEQIDEATVKYDEELLSLDAEEDEDALLDALAEKIKNSQSSEEELKFRKMSDDLQDYLAFLRDEGTLKDWNNLNHRDAGYLLDMAVQQNSEVKDDSAVSVMAVKDKNRRMREFAEILEFIGETKRATMTEQENAWRPMTPEELAAAREQIANIPTSSGRRETPVSPEEPSRRRHENEAESYEEAEERIYSDPEILRDLIDESYAYAEHVMAGTDPNKADSRFGSLYRTFMRQKEGLEKAARNWQENNHGYSDFNEYTQAVIQGDIGDVPDDVLDAASAARTAMLSAQFWRKGPLKRRMTKGVLKDTSPRELAFQEKYFGPQR